MSWFKHRRLVWLVAVVAGCGWSRLSAADEAAAKTEAADDAKPAVKVQSIVIEPEPLRVKPGERMSRMTLVQEPAKLPDTVSWTAETRLHRGRLTSFALNPDQTKACTVGLDGALHIWNLADGKLERIIVGHNSHIMSVSWSPDGKYLASGGWGDTNIRIWDAKTGMPLRMFPSPNGYVGFVAWSPDGTKLLAAGGRSGWIWLWDSKTDQNRLVLETGQDVRSIDWSPDGNQVAVSITQGSVSVVEVTSAKAVQVLDDPTTAHYCVRYSPDGKRIFIGSAGQSIVYELPSGNELDKYQGGGVLGVWSPDGKSLCTSNGGGKARIWGGATTRKRPKAMDIGGTDMQWPTADRIYTIDEVTLTCTNVNSGKKEFEYVIARTEPPVWTSGKPIVTGMNTNELILWDNTTAEKLSTITGHTAKIVSIGFNRDGKLLATASEDKTVGLWETASGSLVTSLKDHTAPLTSVVWSPDGKMLASAGYDQTVRMWTSSGKPVATLEGHKATVTALAWSPRGNLIASGGADGTIILWRTDRKQQSQKIAANKRVEALAFSPDGSAIAAALSEGFVQLWQTATGRLIPKIVSDQRRTAGGVNAIAWAPDGRRMLVAIHSHRAVDLWDLQTSKLERLNVETRGEYVAWSTNGQRMVAGTRDGVVQFWEGLDADLNGLIFEENGHIVLISSNGNYRLDPNAKPDFVFILQKEKEQVMLSVDEFAAKFNWKNVPTQVTFAK